MGTTHRKEGTPNNQHSDVARVCGFSCQNRAFSSPYGLPRVSSIHAELLLYSENRVLCRLGDSEFNDGLGWNLDLLLRLWIEARACFPLLLYQLTKPGQDEFAVLFDFFVREVAERIEEYSSGLLIGLGCFGKSELKFCFGHLLSVMAAAANDFKERRVADRVPRELTPHCEKHEDFGHHLRASGKASTLL